MELEEGRYVQVTSPPTIISALGAIPKADGGVRLIHDCSQPEGYGLNDYATQEQAIKYQTVRDACGLLDQGHYMAKIDLKSAYRSVALHPSQYSYTGLQWTFKGEQTPRFLVDTRLPFGARLSPSHFHRLTQAVQRMIQRRNINCIVYLDDFLITSPTFDQCKSDLSTVISLLRSLGWSIAWNKVTGPSQTLTFLGIDINTINMSLSLPQAKVEIYKCVLRDFLTRSRASQKQLQRLLGKLSWASTVVQGGRVYQQRLLDLLRPLRRPSHKVRLSTEFKEDIRWWLKLLEHTNSSPILTKPTAPVHVFTDASQAGAGMITQYDWAYIDWAIDTPHYLIKHINVKETLSVVAAVYRWAPSWQGKHVIIHTDNITTRAAINKGRCKDPQLMYHLRNLFWLSQFYNFTISCHHIKGTTNIEARTRCRALGKKVTLCFGCHN